MLLKFVAIYALRMLYKPTARAPPPLPTPPSHVTAASSSAATTPRMIVPGFYDSPHPRLSARAAYEKSRPTFRVLIYNAFF